jgi:uncharacterized membrane protein YfcA
MEGLGSLSYLALVYVAFAVVCAGLVHGMLGLGFPLVATPLISLVIGIKAAIVIIVLPTLTVVIVSIVAGGSVRETLRDWWRMPLFMFFGALVGTRVFIVFDPAPLTFLLALIILAYLGLDSIGRAQWPMLKRKPHAYAVVFGFLGGLFEGSVNISAPPLLIYFLSLGLTPGALVRALNLCFGTAKATQFGSLVASAGVPLSMWVSTLPLCVLGAGMSLAGARIRDRVEAATYRRWLKQALFAMAGLLIFQFAMLMRAPG